MTKLFRLINFSQIVVTTVGVIELPRYLLVVVSSEYVNRAYATLQKQALAC